jgi:hypothetical protein
MWVSRLIIITVFLTVAVLLVATNLPFLLVISVSCFAAAAVGRLAIWMQGRRDVER